MAKRPSEEAQAAQTKRARAPSQATKEDLDLRGVTVKHLETGSLDAVQAAGPYFHHSCTCTGGAFCNQPVHSCPLGSIQVGSQQAQIYGIEPAVIRATGAHTVCPRDGHPGAAYVDAIEASQVGRARFMLSYTWGYCCTEIVSAVVAYCDKGHLEHQETALWICCLCINQVPDRPCLL